MTSDARQTSKSYIAELMRERLVKRPDKFPIILYIRMALLGISLVSVIYTIYKLNYAGP